MVCDRAAPLRRHHDPVLEERRLIEQHRAALAHPAGELAAAHHLRERCRVNEPSNQFAQSAPEVIYTVPIRSIDGLCTDFESV